MKVQGLLSPGLQISLNYKQIVIRYYLNQSIDSYCKILIALSMLRMRR